MRSLLLVVAVVAACSDNIAFPTAPALVQTADLAIVAHEDDDLLFMQPDLLDDLHADSPLTIVYITAGNATHGVAYTESRQSGIMNGYGAYAGESLDDWQCGWFDLGGHPAQHCKLGNISLVFLGYPDGGEQGQLRESMLKLWEGEVSSGETMSRQPSYYTQDQLIDAVSSIITTTAPTTVHILDVASTHGHDHVDHEIAAALALIAITRSGTAPHIVGYRGYDVAGEGVDKPAPMLDAQVTALEAYDSCISIDDSPCRTPLDTTDPEHVIWAARRYGIGFRSSLHDVTIAGSDGAGCVALDEDMMATLVDCTTAPTWSLAPSGEFAMAAPGSNAGSAACLQVLPTGELAGIACDPATDAPVDDTRRLFVDDEGHVWGGLVPVPQADMEEQHLDCMAASGGRPRLVLCGAGNAPTWTFARAATAAAAVVVPTGGRPALADFDKDGLADLAYDDGTQLFFAHGNGDGTFAPAQLLGALRVVPASFVAADVDGDGVADGCGQATGGDDVVCALSSAHYTSTTEWNAALAPIAAIGTAGEASLAAIDGELCAVTGTRSIDCAARGSAVPERLSNAPVPGTPVWYGPLFDAHADWCSAGQDGAACGLRADAYLTDDAVPWSYSLAGAVEAPPIGIGETALADVDGDGWADLCGLGSDAVTCARGQGHGFGPTLDVAALAGGDGAQLVLGDLDGDGHADACAVAITGAVTCQLVP